ncbi:MAG: NAD(P)H-hydrate dehydratase [Ruminococcaceae bacterium]|nr:NAD(P)H-hydrate dehydratase [Oscillospiraceae bacterium]
MKVICPEYIKSIMPKRSADANKYSVGSLLCVAGSYTMAGAAVLSARAALRTGAGYVRCVVTEEIYPIVSAAVPEAVFLVLPSGKGGAVSARYTKEIIKAANKADAVLCGCGLGQSEDAKSIVESLVFETDTPLLLDADGINIINKHIDILKDVKKPLVLTPHEGEMKRLTGIPSSYIHNNREAVLKSFCEEYKAVTVLKGKDTLILQHSKEMYKNPTGNAGMAVAGSGDVLAGMIASLMAQGVNAFDSALAGVYLHGLAGDLGARELTEYSLLPSDIIDYIPKAIKSVLKSREV